MIQLVDREQRDAQFARLRLSGLGGRDRLDLEAVLDHLSHSVDHVICGRAGAETNYHTVLYIFSGFIAGQLFHIHRKFLP